MVLAMVSLDLRLLVSLVRVGVQTCGEPSGELRATYQK